MINSNFLGKMRVQVVKKLVFLFVFALIALTCVATPLAVFAACPDDGTGNLPPDVTPGVIGATTRLLGRRLQPRPTPNSSGVNTLNISSTNLRQLLVVLETGTLQFVDAAGNVVDFGTLRTGQVFKITVNNTTQNVSAKLLGKTLALITLPRNIQQQVFFANIKSPCLSSKTFRINLGGSATPQIGQCLDKNSASVTIPGSSIPTIIVFPQSLKV